jgi:pimeloyl-ACP methyl ester carboxylesterase
VADVVAEVRARRARRRALPACLVASLPAPFGYHQAIVRPLAHTRERIEKLAGVLSTPLLQLHGADDGCIVAPTDDDARQFEHGELQVVEGVWHFLHLEAPSGIAHRILDWLVCPFIRLKVQHSWSTLSTQRRVRA